MKLVVFDIDGTLSLVGDRKECLSRNPPDWDEFYDRCNEDIPNKPICDLFLRLFFNPGFQFILLTGRRESCREKTVEWIKKHLLPDNFYKVDIKMRKDGDHRPDTEIKPEMLNQVLVDYNLEPKDVLYIFEDRKSVVDKWRELGYTCLQVADGNF